MCRPVGWIGWVGGVEYVRAAERVALPSCSLEDEEGREETRPAVTQVLNLFVDLNWPFAGVCLCPATLFGSTQGYFSLGFVSSGGLTR